MATATALNRGLRSGIRLLATGAEASKTGKRLDTQKTSSRGFHATGMKRMGGHGHDEPYYLHAKHMYNLHRMKHQKPKVYLSVLGAVGIGIGVPIYAVVFQQKKTASG
uniref:SLL1 protein n=1 Tax=Oryza barthii TaxID=65489 RepID=A0A0D3FW12_9ORYZ